MSQNYTDLPRYKVTPHFYKELWNHQHNIVKLTKTLGIVKMARKLNYPAGKFSVIHSILKSTNLEDTTQYSQAQFQQLKIKDINTFYIARNYIVHHINWVGLVSAGKDLGINHSELSAVYNILKPYAQPKPPSDYRAPEHPDQLEFYHINNNLAHMDDSAEIEHSKKDSYTPQELEYLRRPKDDLTPQEVNYLRTYQDDLTPQEREHLKSIRRGQ